MIRRLLIPLSLLCAIGWDAVAQQNPQKPACGHCTNTPESAASDQKPTESFWKPSTYEPITAYTSFLAIFSGALVLVSIIQIAFLIKADKTASISAKAALKAAKAAIEGSYLERAWVSPKAVTTALLIDCEYNGIRYPQAYGFRIEWTNSGRTPAREVDMFIAKDKVYRGAPVPTFTAKFKENARSIIGPKMVRETNFIVVTMPEVQELIAGSHDLYIYSKIIYFDVFLPAQRTAELVYRVRCIGDIVSADGPVTKHFQFAALGPQNVCT